jgi:hypothetical protein
VADEANERVVCARVCSYEEVTARGEKLLEAEHAIESLADDLDDVVEERDAARVEVLKLEAEKRALMNASGGVAPLVADAVPIATLVAPVIAAMPLEDVVEPLAELADELEDDKEVAMELADEKEDEFNVAVQIADELEADLASTRKAYNELAAAAEAERAAVADEVAGAAALAEENASLKAQLEAAQELILSLTKPEGAAAADDVNDIAVEEAKAPSAEKAPRAKRATKAKSVVNVADKENGAMANEADGARTRRSTRLTSRS